MVSGRYALIERAQDFTLVPWRELLEPHLGKSVAATMRGASISWTIRRARSGPAIA
ncbi:MAG: DUF3363 domain-containing protein [Sphingomonas sp.]|nr:DUF3363 domain-containing protein [Sphingomonas sp.]